MQVIVFEPSAKRVDSSPATGQDQSKPIGMPPDEALQWGDKARWNDENRAAISDYNARIEREGLPLAKYRSFMKRV